MEEEHEDHKEGEEREAPGEGGYQQGHEGGYQVVWPSSPSGIQKQRRAARLDNLAHKKVAFLWDYLFRGDELFPVLAKELQARFDGIEIIGYEEFGNLHGADEKERVGRLPDDLRNRGVDAVVSGMGC